MTILDGALVWIATLAEGRRISRAVAEATGEQVLSVDPTESGPLTRRSSHHAGTRRMNAATERGA